MRRTSVQHSADVLAACGTNRSTCTHAEIGTVALEPFLLRGFVDGAARLARRDALVATRILLKFCALVSAFFQFLAKFDVRGIMMPARLQILLCLCLVPS